MKKDLVSGLIKVANNLDSLGYMEETNIVDRVAKKIVVSQYTYKTHDQSKGISMTGDYITDITNYKNLIYSAYHKNNGTYQTDPCKEHLGYANKLLNAVLTAMEAIYDTKTKKAFKIQADRILNDVEGDSTDINIAYTTPDESKPLNHYLVKYRITDSGGILLPEITNINELNRRFMKMKNDPVIKNVTPENYFTTQLGNTYNLLKLQL